MSVRPDPVEVAVEDELHEFSLLSRKPVTPVQPITPVQPALGPAGAVTARLHSFGSDDRPMLVDVPGLPGELVAARTTVPLVQDNVGSTVVVLFEQADVRRPIVVGVLEERRAVSSDVGDPSLRVTVQADDQRLVLSAEREIVLHCGQASITLTRAGKVIIKGSYIVSRSSGYNRIKGAAVDIN
jgi:hypothetical protein